VSPYEAGTSGAVSRALSRPFFGVPPSVEQPPESVDFDLEEALSLLAALEDSRDVLIDTDHLAVLSQVEHQIQILSRKLGLDQGGPDVY
jgi:hypothetical protein